MRSQRFLQILLILLAFPLSSWAGQLCFSDGHCISDPSITGDPDAQRGVASEDRSPPVDLTIRPITGGGQGTMVIAPADQSSLALAEELCRRYTNEQQKLACRNQIVACRQQNGSSTSCTISVPADQAQGQGGQQAQQPQPPGQQGGGGQQGPQQPGQQQGQQGDPQQAQGGQGQEQPQGQSAAEAMCRFPPPERSPANSCDRGAFDRAHRACLGEDKEAAEEACSENAATVAAGDAIQGIGGALGGQARANESARGAQQATNRHAGASCRFSQQCEEKLAPCQASCQTSEEIYNACKQVQASAPQPMREAAEHVKRTFESEREGKYAESRRVCFEQGPQRAQAARQQTDGNLQASQQQQQTERNTGGQQQNGAMQSMGELLKSIMQAQQNEEKKDEQQQQTVDLCASASMASTRECRCRGLSDAQCNNVMAGSSPHQQGAGLPAAPQPYVGEPGLPAQQVTPAGSRRPASAYGY